MVLQEYFGQLSGFVSVGRQQPLMKALFGCQRRFAPQRTLRKENCGT